MIRSLRNKRQHEWKDIGLAAIVIAVCVALGIVAKPFSRILLSLSIIAILLVVTGFAINLRANAMKRTKDTAWYEFLMNGGWEQHILNDQRRVIAMEVEVTQLRKSAYNWPRSPSRAKQITDLRTLNRSLQESHQINLKQLKDIRSLRTEIADYEARYGKSLFPQDRLRALSITFERYLKNVDEALEAITKARNATPDEI